MVKPLSGTLRETKRLLMDLSVGVSSPYTSWTRGIINPRGLVIPGPRHTTSKLRTGVRMINTLE